MIGENTRTHIKPVVIIGTTITLVLFLAYIKWGLS